VLFFAAFEVEASEERFDFYSLFCVEMGLVGWLLEHVERRFELIKVFVDGQLPLQSVGGCMFCHNLLLFCR
jgi:hypothetical protein